MDVYVFSNRSSHSNKNRIEYVQRKLKQIFPDIKMISYDNIETIDLSKIDTLIFSGGDGVFSNIINRTYYYNIIYGYIPMGTANDVSHNLEIKNIDEALDIIKKKCIADYPLIRINNKYACYAISVGPMSNVSLKASKIEKKGLNKNIYKLRGMKYMFCKKEKVAIRIGQQEIKTKARVLLVLRTKFLGGIQIEKKVSSNMKIVFVKNIFDLIRIFIFKKVKGIDCNELNVKSDSLWCVDGEKLDCKEATIEFKGTFIKLLSKKA